MLSRGLDLNSRDSDNKTPLMIAACNGKMEAVNYLLEKGADPSLRDKFGRNSLHDASDGGNVTIIETILSRGLDINSRDSDNNTALMIAACNGKMEAVNYSHCKPRSSMESCYHYLLNLGLDHVTALSRTWSRHKFKR